MFRLLIFCVRDMRLKHYHLGSLYLIPLYSVWYFLNEMICKDIVFWCITKIGIIPMLLAIGGYLLYHIHKPV